MSKAVTLFDWWVAGADIVRCYCGRSAKSTAASEIGCCDGSEYFPKGPTTTVLPSDPEVPLALPWVRRMSKRLQARLFKAALEHRQEKEDDMNVVKSPKGQIRVTATIDRENGQFVAGVTIKKHAEEAWKLGHPFEGFVSLQRASNAHTAVSRGVEQALRKMRTFDKERRATAKAV